MGMAQGYSFRQEEHKRVIESSDVMPGHQALLGSLLNFVDDKSDDLVVINIVF